MNSENSGVLLLIVWAAARQVCQPARPLRFRGLTLRPAAGMPSVLLPSLPSVLYSVATHYRPYQMYWTFLTAAQFTCRKNSSNTLCCRVPLVAVYRINHPKCTYCADVPTYFTWNWNCGWWVVTCGELKYAAIMQQLLLWLHVLHTLLLAGWQPIVWVTLSRTWFPTKDTTKDTTVVRSFVKGPPVVKVAAVNVFLS